jgi:hypothetical protein
MDLQFLSDVGFCLMAALCLAVAAYRNSRYGNRARDGALRVRSADSIGRAPPVDELRPGVPVSLVAVSIVFGAPLFLLLQNDSGVAASKAESGTRSAVGEVARQSLSGHAVLAGQNYCPANYTDQGAGEDGGGMSRENR